MLTGIKIMIDCSCKTCTNLYWLRRGIR